MLVISAKGSNKHRIALVWRFFCDLTLGLLDLKFIAWQHPVGILDAR